MCDKNRFFLIKFNKSDKTEESNVGNYGWLGNKPESKL